MKVGDLVKVKRASIGVPLDSVGLIVKTKFVHYVEDSTRGSHLHFVLLPSGLIIFFIESDLEVINESR